MRPNRCVNRVCDVMSVCLDVDVCGSIKRPWLDKHIIIVTYNYPTVLSCTFELASNPGRRTTPFLPFPRGLWRGLLCNKLEHIVYHKINNTTQYTPSSCVYLLL